MDYSNSPVAIETPQELASRLKLKFNDWLLLSRALTLSFIP